MNIGMNIVVVEDNHDLRDALVELLREQGHRVTGLSCAEDLDDEGGQAAIDLLVVDLNLPDEDGLSLARRMRHAQPGLRILMMTSRHTVSDKVRGYESGADIYLTKPMNQEEFSAAVQALGRQLQLQLQLQPAPDRDAGRPLLRIRVESLQASGPNGTVGLNAGEVALLCGLARATGQRLAHWQLLALMGQGDASLAKLAVWITRLRQKLIDLGLPEPALQAIRGEGYRLCLTTELL